MPIVNSFKLRFYLSASFAAFGICWAILPSVNTFYALLTVYIGIAANFSLLAYGIKFLLQRRSASMISLLIFGKMIIFLLTLIISVQFISNHQIIPMIFYFLMLVIFSLSLKFNKEKLILGM